MILNVYFGKLLVFTTLLDSLMGRLWFKVCIFLWTPCRMPWHDQTRRRTEDVPMQSTHEHVEEFPFCECQACACFSCSSGWRLFQWSGTTTKIFTRICIRYKESDNWILPFLLLIQNWIIGLCFSTSANMSLIFIPVMFTSRIYGLSWWVLVCSWT